MDNETNSEKPKMTVKEALDAAYSAGWEAILKSLGDNGISYDDCDGGIFVDDAEEKKTYCLNVTQIECDEYGGDDK